MRLASRSLSLALSLSISACGAATSPSVPTAQPPAAAPRCSFRPDDDPSHVVMTYQDGLDTVVVGANGATRTLFTIEEPDGAGAFYSAGSTPRGRFVVASASWGPNAGALIQRDVLLDDTGRVYWQRTMPPSTTSSLFLGANGTVAIQTSTWDHAPRYAGVIVNPDGTSHAYDGLRVLAAPGTDGRAPVVRVEEWDASTRSIAWLDAATGSTTPMSIPLVGSATESAQWIAGRFVYVGSTPDGPAVVAAHGSSADVIHVPGAGPGVALQFAQATSSHWVRVAVGSAPDATQWRIDVVNATATPFVALEPEGLRRFSYGPVLLDDLGQSMMPMRDADVGALYVSPTGRGPWSRVGGTVADVLAVDIDQRGGTYVIRGTNDRFVGEMWPSMPTEIADVSGVATQLVRPSDGVSYRLDTPEARSWDPIAPTLTRDGICAAWSSTVDGRVEIDTLDVPTGARHTFTPRTTGAYFGGFAWVEND